MKEPTSAVIGFAAAAVVPAAAGALTSPGLGGGFGTDATMFLMLTALFYIYSVFFTAVFGIPLFLLLRRFALVRWWSAAISGFAIGVVAILIALPPFDVSNHDDIRVLALWGLIGMLAAFVFWVIWRSGAHRNVAVHAHQHSCDA